MNDQINIPVIADDLLQAVAEGRSHDPHAVLGRHPVNNPQQSPAAPPTYVIRTLRPLAKTVSIIFAAGKELALEHVGHGIWAGITPNPAEYRVRSTYSDKTQWETDDPYRFQPTLGELDLHLIAEGRHEELWRVLGAHHHDQLFGTTTNGTAFAVWAPRAKAARVIGDFNAWDGRGHSMRSMGGSGVWELFVPDLAPGTRYKFELLTQAGVWQTRADPMAQFAEIAPATSSIVTLTAHSWRDDEWMAQRTNNNPHNLPMSIYELHLGSWRPGKGYREVADELIEYVNWLGYTHVEFMPLAEHPFGGSWGYQVTGYYAATSRFGTPDDLRYLIDRLHQSGIGVIMDWVPGHFPKDEWALANFDGEPLYEHPDPRRGEHPDWGTLVFDYGNPRVRNFLVANALFWLEEFHVDALRVDAVASMLYLDYSRKPDQWLPNEHGGREHFEAIRFIQEATATAYKRNPGVVIIAEESTSWPGVTSPTSFGGLGFGYKWNMGWMHDSLEYIGHDPMYRSYHHSELTFSLHYAFSEHFILPISHDEVVHGKGSLLQKMPGDSWQQRANLRAYLAFMWAHPGKKLLFMGQEFGQLSEWSEQRGLDWWMLDQPAHRQIAEYVGALNRLYRKLPELWQLDDDAAGFEWVEGGAAAENVIAFLRYGHDRSPTLCVVNFAGHPRENFRLGLPQGGKWNEILNSDAIEFGGSGVGNLGSVEAINSPWAGRPASAEFRLPPLGALWFQLDTYPPRTT